MQPKSLLLILTLILVLPLISAETTFFEMNYHIYGWVPNGGGGLAAGGISTISCWKIVDNTCVLEELENYYCPPGYFSTESICESSLEIVPEKSFFERVFDKVKEFFEPEDEVISEDSEEVIEDTEEEITEDKINKSIIIVLLIIIAFLVLNKK